MLNYLIPICLSIFCVFRMVASYQPYSRSAEFIGNVLLFGPITLGCVLFIVFLCATHTPNNR